MRKTLAISLGNGSLKDRCIRPDDENFVVIVHYAMYHITLSGIKYPKAQSTVNSSACLIICAPLSAL
uniref:N-acetylmuramoyl-L-alanine amidase n=1 Tax=Heterorhabditis bacteriophora TaxID=37862 RepID=A0A1I7X4G0_HETBA